MNRQNTNIANQDDNGPHNQDFKQQRLQPVCSPILTSTVIKVVLIAIGVTFITLGTILFVFSDDVVSKTYTYQNRDACKTNINMDSSVLPKVCEIEVKLDADMELPVYFYYELGNFYQNHREFLASYSFYQLNEEKLTETESCKPLDTYNNKHLYPCGLIANSFFSDRFTMYVNGQTLCPNCVYENVTSWNTTWENWYNDNGPWKRKGIAWEVDVKERFKYDSNWESQSDSVTRVGKLQERQGLFLPKINDEDYMVWARSAALPNFRKLHRIIDSLPSGEKKLKKDDTISVVIANFFSVDEFDGEKKFTLTTLSWFGGPVTGMAIAYLVVGCLSTLIAGALFIREPPRKLGDYTVFQWENLHQAH